MAMSNDFKRHVLSSLSSFQPLRGPMTFVENEDASIVLYHVMESDRVRASCKFRWIWFVAHTNSSARVLHEIVVLRDLELRQANDCGEIDGSQLYLIRSNVYSLAGVYRWASSCTSPASVLRQKIVNARRSRNRSRRTHADHRHIFA